MNMIREYHQHIIEQDMARDEKTFTALINLCGRCKEPTSARTLFDWMCDEEGIKPNNNVALIQALAETELETLSTSSTP